MSNLAKGEGPTCPTLTSGTKYTYLLGFLLKFLDDTLVDSTAFVDEMAGRGGLAGIDVTNDDDVNVELFFSHFSFMIATSHVEKEE